MASKKIGSKSAGRANHKSDYYSGELVKIEYKYSYTGDGIVRFDPTDFAKDEHIPTVRKVVEDNINYMYDINPKDCTIVRAGTVTPHVSTGDYGGTVKFKVDGHYMSEQDMLDYVKKGGAFTIEPCESGEWSEIDLDAPVWTPPADQIERTAEDPDTQTLED